jgi:hypothetical protein
VSWVSSPTNAQAYSGFVTELADAHHSLIGELKPASNTPGDIVKAIRAILGDDLEKRLGISETDLTTWFSSEIDLVTKASQGLGCSSAATFHVDVPFDTLLEWKSSNALIKDPPGDTVPILFSAWQVAGSTGFAFSGLTDNHYTVRTVTVTPAQGSTAAVTKRVAVAESDDSYLPEVTGFVHFMRFGNALGCAGRKTCWMPRQYSVGGGLSAGLSGRVYLGVSWPLGRVGSITLGAAGGQVKRLSKNVDRDNLGTTDPEASRRDVIRTSWFFGVSWRVLGAQNP